MSFQRKEQIQMTVVSGKVETSTASIANQYDYDWYVSIILSKHIEFSDYIEVNKDTYQLTIPRQEINPYFYELGFFETIQSIDYDKENLSFWSDIISTNNISFNNSPVLYNTLFNVMSPSLLLKAPVFDLQLEPIQTASTTSDVITIVNEMNSIKQTTNANQLSFAETAIAQLS